MLKNILYYATEMDLLYSTSFYKYIALYVLLNLGKDAFVAIQ